MNETGLSLGGGCLRGVAHIGVLKELKDRGISITHIAGTSAGAVMGGLYASGLELDSMVKSLESLSIRRLFDFSLNRKGILKGDHIYNTLLKLTDGKNFSDLDIPFAVVCVDLHARKVVVINDGEVAKALRASIAIPGVFSPVEIGGRLLVDGFILNNNPADVVREMGATHVTAVKVRSSEKQDSVRENAFSYINSYIDLASALHTERLVKKFANILVDIDLGNVGRVDPKSFSSAIKLGQETTRKMLGQREEHLHTGRIVYMDEWIKSKSS